MHKDLITKDCLAQCIIFHLVDKLLSAYFRFACSIKKEIFETKEVKVNSSSGSTSNYIIKGRSLPHSIM